MPVAVGSSLAAGRRGGVSRHSSAVLRGTESPGSGGDVAWQGRPCAGLTLYFSFLFPPLQPHDIRAQVSAARTQAPGARLLAGIALTASAASCSPHPDPEAHPWASSWVGLPGGPSATESHRAPCAGCHPR